MSDEVIHQFPLRMGDGSKIPAILTRWKGDAACRVVLTAEGIREEASASDYFEAFASVRRSLAERGIMPLCYGAGKGVWPSGMARDMGQGLKAYRLADRQLVDIFEAAPDLEVATPVDQLGYAVDWLCRAELPHEKPRAVYEFDGYLAPVWLLAIFPMSFLFGMIVETLDVCEKSYGQTFGVILGFALAVGFAISGLRQSNVGGRVFASLTLAVVAIGWLMFPVVN